MKQGPMYANDLFVMNENSKVMRSKISHLFMSVNSHWLSTCTVPVELLTDVKYNFTYLPTLHVYDACHPHIPQSNLGWGEHCLQTNN